jgi:hypothetical protein
MSYESKDQIFLYHGYGIGLGGYLERYGMQLPIPSVASVALSLAGGETTNKVGPWQWAPEDEPPTSEGGFRISVRGVTARLWTEETPKEWISNAEIHVSGFNLCDRVEIGHMVSRLKSTHKKKHVERNPKISFAGSGFWNVKIEGKPVPITLDGELDDCASRDELRDLLKKRKYADSIKSDYMKDLLKKHVRDDYTRCSIAADVRHDKKDGYSVELAGFGRVFFGEMLVGDGDKHLTMFRWSLGCDNCGDGTGGGSYLNGDSMP